MVSGYAKYLGGTDFITSTLRGQTTQEQEPGIQRASGPPRAWWVLSHCNPRTGHNHQRAQVLYNKVQYDISDTSYHCACWVWTQFTYAVPGDSIHVEQGTTEPVNTAEMLAHPCLSLSLCILL